MAASDAQIIQVQAHAYEKEWRVFVGAPPSFVNMALFEQGEPVTLPADTFLTAPIADIRLNTTIAVDSTSGYPDSGVVPIRKAASLGQAGGTSWVEYQSKTSTTFVNCRLVNGYQGSFPKYSKVGGGWVDISDRVNLSSIEGSGNWDGVLFDWEYTLSGQRFNQTLMYEDATVMIQARVSPSGYEGGRAWTSWYVVAMGYIREWNVDYGADGLRDWSATVESIWSYLSTKNVQSKRYGQENILEGASVEVSSTLQNPVSEVKEWGGGMGTTAGANITDNKPDTLWISEQIPISERETEGSSGATLDPLIEEVGIWFDPSIPSDLQYIVLRLPKDAGGATVPPDAEGRGKLFISGLSLDGYYLSYSDTDFRKPFDRNYPPEVGGSIATPEGWDDSGNYIRLPNVTLSEDNPTIVLCRNAEIFRRYYAVSSGVQIYDWRTLGGFGNDGMTAEDFFLRAAGDVLWLRCTGVDVPNRIRDMLTWGDNTLIYLNGKDEDYATPPVSPEQWDGSNVPVPNNNYSIRRKPACTDTNEATDWYEETDPMPGNPRTNNDGEWAMVTFPLFECHLAADITNTVPGVGQTIEFDEGAANLEFAGTIQIDGEQIAYTDRRKGNKATVTQRGANGTTAASHDTDSLIYIVDTEIGSHRLPLMETVQVKRQLRLFTPGERGVPITADIAQFWGSTAEDPAVPGEGSWSIDWIGERELVHYDAPPEMTEKDYAFPLSPRRRLRKGLIRIRKMTDEGRAKINEVQGYKSVILSSDAQTINDEIGMGAVFRDLLETVVARDLISIDAQAFVGTKAEIEIAEGGLGDILRELCEQYAVTLRMTRDGRVIVSRDPHHPLGSRQEVKITFKSYMMRGSKEKPSTAYKTRLSAPQLIYEIYNPDTEQTLEGRYPANETFAGTERKQGKMRVLSVEDANSYAARKYLSDERISRPFRFATVGVCDFVDAGDRVLTWDNSDESLDNTDQRGRYVNCLVRGIQWTNRGYAKIAASEWRMI